MSFLIVVIHIILAVVLFYLVNWIGEKTKPLDFGYVNISLEINDDTAPFFNYLFKILAPVVFIVLVMAFFQAIGLDSFNEKIYWVVIDYWLCRLLFLVIRGRLGLLNWPVQIFYWISSIGLSILVCNIVARSGTVLPKAEDLLEELWILIIVFLYSVLNKIQYSRKGAEQRIKKYVKVRYDNFRKQYGQLVGSSVKIKSLEIFVYSIMIYEDFNRPKHARFVERIVFRKSKKDHTYGVMQVMSDKPISDGKSVVLATTKIKELIKAEVDNEDWDKVYMHSVYERVAQQYNPGDTEYAQQVMHVFDLLVELSGGDLYEDIDKSVLLQSLE